MRRSYLKRRTPMRRAGRRTNAWTRVRRQLKREFSARGITACELQFAGCWKDNALSFAHTKKRRHIKGDEIKRCVLACVPCHTVAELMGEARMEPLLEMVISRRQV